MQNRPTWHEYFMKMAQLASTRSSCLRRKVGAVIVRENQILSTGYNGSPKRIQHCSETGCLREQLGVPSGEKHELCRGVHAEQNAIIQAAVNGNSLKGANLYCTNQPCAICSKMLINAEISNIYIAHAYPDELSQQMLREAAVNVYLINMENFNVEKII